MPALTTFRTHVQADWVDYNGHLRDAFYLLIFSYATDALMETLGMATSNLDGVGHSLFTLECHINYLHEVKLDAAVEVRTQIIGHDRKRLHIFHSLHLTGADDVLAGSEQMLLNVDLAGPHSAVFADDVALKLAEIVGGQKDLERPQWLGRVIALPGGK